MSRLAVAVAVAALLATATAALAHSLLLESSPAVDGAVTAPRAMSLRFNNRIEKRLSKLRLVDAARRVTPLTVSLDGPADRLEAPLAALAPGAYRLEWQVLSIDGHVVSGTFGFRVLP